ncbi:DUF916 domain-containing protein [Microbacterium sp. P04]|uniref:COG1470 family protein n=1 Tax=Microbacterium sp. P04 TaxID=3366947 RepID=UPI003745B406
MSQAILSPSPRRRTPLAVVLGVVLALTMPVGAALAETTPEPGADTTVSWSVRPADTAQGRDRPNFAYELTPGATLSDALTVTNRSAEPIALDVYAADGFLTADGALDILAGGEVSTELGSWIDFDVPQLTLDSGESAEVPFTIAVPAATPPGDYAAGVVASMLVRADTGTVTERRLGSRIHLRVLGDLAPALAISDVTVDYHGTANPIEGGAATVTYTLVNTGNTRLDPTANVSLSGPFGWAPVGAGDDAPELLPGSSIQRTVEVGSVPPLGLLTVDVTSSGEIVSPGIGAAEASDPVVAETGSASTAAVPWTALALLLVAAGLIAWRILARKRAKAAHRREIEAAVAAAKAERAGGESATDAAATAPSPVTAGASPTP